MVRCADCGLLGRRRRATGEMFEVDASARESGHVDPSPMGNNALWLLVCTAHATNLSHEIRQQLAQDSGSDIAPDAALAPAQTITILHRDRVCESFTPWHEGFSPKEHAEMVLAAEFRREAAVRAEADQVWRDEQRRQDDERQERRAAWEQEQRRLDLEWRAEQDRESKRQHRATLNATVGVSAVILGVLGLLGSCIQAGWIANPLATPAPTPAPIVVPAPQVNVTVILPTPAPLGGP